MFQCICGQGTATEFSSLCVHPLYILCSIFISVFLAKSEKFASKKLELFKVVDTHLCKLSCQLFLVVVRNVSSNKYQSHYTANFVFATLRRAVKVKNSSLIWVVGPIYIHDVIARSVNSSTVGKPQCTTKGQHRCMFFVSNAHVPGKPQSC